jgi:penicillin-binding protein-related factor A (putative recombinase)
MQKGKKLEKEVKDYLNKQDIFYHKFTDSYAARGFAQPVPSDFILFPKQGPAIMLECKETQKELLPLTAFRPSQFEAMKQCAGNKSVEYYIVVKLKKDYILIHSCEVLLCLRQNYKSLDLSSYVKMDIPTIIEMIQEDIKNYSSL